MGESNWEERVKLLTPYRITMDMLKMTGNADNGQLIFMHCLPAFHDTETEYGKKIAEELQKQFGIKLDKRLIQVKSPIRSVGLIDVPVKIYQDVTSVINLRVKEG